jgi:hypothetical protein
MIWGGSFMEFNVRQLVLLVKLCDHISVICMIVWMCLYLQVPYLITKIVCIGALLIHLFLAVPFAMKLVELSC